MLREYGDFLEDPLSSDINKQSMMMLLTMVMIPPDMLRWKKSSLTLG